MKISIYIFFLITLLVSLVKTQANLPCTVLCTSYWVCVARNILKGGDCKEPYGCECRKFAL